MNFQEQLQQQLNQLEDGGVNFNDQETKNPYNDLKHDQIQLKENPSEAIVRILPPKGDEFFASGFQEMFVQARNKNGKDLNTYLNFPLQLQPNDSELDQQLLEWIKTKEFPNSKGYGPSKRFLINAIKVAPDPNTGQFVHETDQQGKPVVRTMKLPKTAYDKIITALGDEMTNHGINSEYGFISPEKAYPVKVSRSKSSEGQVQYNVDVYQNIDLGPAPIGWEEELEDLDYQATPSEELNKDFTDYLRAVIGGYEEEFNANRKQNNGGNQGRGQKQSGGQPNFNQSPPSQQPPTQSQSDSIGNITQDANAFESNLPTGMQNMPNQGQQQAPPEQPNFNQNQPPKQTPNQVPNQNNQQPNFDQTLEYDQDTPMQSKNETNNENSNQGQQPIQDVDAFLAQAKQKLGDM